jgi:hypothetical protein
VGKASSSKKVARLAAKGKGKKVRFQNGTIFPAVVAAIAVIGSLLLVYSRASIPEKNIEPSVGANWQIPYGFYLCDEWREPLSGSKESPEEPGYDLYLDSGVNSRDDGVIYWNPVSEPSVSAGRSARLDVFLDVYGVELSDSRLTFPDDQGGDVFDEGNTKCDGKDARLSVITWDSPADTSKGQRDVANLGQQRIQKSGQVFAIVFAAEAADPGLPPSATGSAVVTPDDTGAPTDSGAPADSGAPTDSGAPDSVAPDTAAPDTAPPTTEG